MRLFSLLRAAMFFVVYAVTGGASASPWINGEGTRTPERFDAKQRKATNLEHQGHLQRGTTWVGARALPHARDLNFSTG